MSFFRKEINLSKLLEEAIALGQFPSGDKPIINVVKLPSKAELELAKHGQLSIGRAAELGMYNTPGESASLSEWKNALKCGSDGSVVSACFGLARAEELGFGTTKFVP